MQTNSVRNCMHQPQVITHPWRTVATLVCCLEQKDQAEAQFERAFQVLELRVREQRSTTLAIVHAAANNFHQQYQALQHENERLQQHVRTLSPPSPASKVTLPLPGYVSVYQHYITEYCIEKRDPITGKRII